MDPANFHPARPHWQFLMVSKNNMIAEFNNTIDPWIGELDRYDLSQLCAKPAADSWSVGQVYIHLIDATRYFIEQALICASNNENAGIEIRPNTRMLLINNALPNEIIEGPPENAYTKQPVSKEQLIIGLQDLKVEVSNAWELISSSPFRGKSRHPGLHYFSANEWLQFAEMHFRHHLRQKERIDNFLRTSYPVTDS